MAASPVDHYRSDFFSDSLSYSTGTMEYPGRAEHVQTSPASAGSCPIQHIYSSLKDSRRAKILVSLFANTFLFDVKLHDSRRGSWGCPFESCKFSSPDAQEFMLHVLYCDRFDCSNAYCSCCDTYGCFENPKKNKGVMRKLTNDIAEKFMGKVAISRSSSQSSGHSVGSSSAASAAPAVSSRRGTAVPLRDVSPLQLHQQTAPAPNQPAPATSPLELETLTHVPELSDSNQPLGELPDSGLSPMEIFYRQQQTPPSIFGPDDVGLTESPVEELLMSDLLDHALKEQPAELSLDFGPHRASPGFPFQPGAQQQSSWTLPPDHFQAPANIPQFQPLAQIGQQPAAPMLCQANFASQHRPASFPASGGTSRNSSQSDSYYDGSPLARVMSGDSMVPATSAQAKAVASPEFSPSPSANDDFQCRICGKVMGGQLRARKGYLRKHMKNQHGSCGHFRCPECLKKFKRKDNLDQHLRKYCKGSAQGAKSSLQSQQQPPELQTKKAQTW